jgi:hypothetical protein
VRRDPVEIRSYFPATACPLSRESQTEVARKLGNRECTSYSDVLHWLRLCEGPLPRRGAAAGAVVSDLVDSGGLERRFRAPSALVRTPYGVRYLTAKTTDSAELRRSRGLHAYQTPAVFGEVGVPSMVAVRAGDYKGSVADLVRDCLLNFQLREVTSFEPEWAVTALALYLPPVRSWRNRWGEQVSFDGIAEFLVGRDISRYACEGTHLLSALGFLIQADEQFSILSRRAAGRVVDVCRRIGRETLASLQRPDGSWGSDWAGGDSGVPPQPWHSVHITGHLMECQILLPPDLQAPAGCLGRALNYLAQAVAETDAQDMARAYCPYSHAGRVVLRWGANHA